MAKLQKRLAKFLLLHIYTSLKTLTQFVTICYQRHTLTYSCIVDHVKKQTTLVSFVIYSRNYKYEQERKLLQRNLS